MTKLILSLVLASALSSPSVHTLRNSSGAEARIIDYGARIISLKVPDRQGNLRDVVLGFESPVEYIARKSSFGAVMGRYANCIGGASFELDGIRYELPKNKDGRHCMHGGPEGFHNRSFTPLQTADNSIVLGLSSADGEAGFPGELTLKVKYTLSERNELRIDYEAVCDKPTVLNLTSHSFFNLSGDASRDVTDHILTIDADRFTPTDGSPVPTGEISSVDGTEYDFRAGKAIGSDMTDKGYNLNYILNNQGSLNSPAATCICPASGIVMKVYTDQPGLQLYTAENLDGSLRGKDGIPLARRKGVCLETQHFPDSPNNPQFPSTVLRPGETFKSTTVYAFSTVGSRDIYLDLMETAVNAYSLEHIKEYIQRVDREGITEHGFARLTSNIGILISQGRLGGYCDLFIRMMDICTREIPTALAKNGTRGEIGNDFAVKEICCCILEAERSGLFPKEKTDSWRRAVTGMRAEDIYSVQPTAGDAVAHNWCVFGSASECARLMTGMGGDRSYADYYLEDQMRFFDANGMYMDPGAPILYDFVTRLQYMAALDFGYDGPAKDGILDNLRKSAIPTLQMQAASGEMPYGGRSNRFLHNDTAFAAVCEFYARWMKQLGDEDLAQRFKAAARRAVEAVLFRLAEKPVHHVKNRYPVESGYGCETYAYFDKYMVTMGSWAYLAWRFADDSISPSKKKEPASTFVPEAPWHRIFMKAGGYSVQFDLDAQKEYDSEGIGCFQKAGEPPTIGLSSPCPPGVKRKEAPAMGEMSGGEPHLRLSSATGINYTLDIMNEGGLAIAPLWDKYLIRKARKRKVILSDGNASWSCRLSRKGLMMTLRGEGLQTITIPVLTYDGGHTVCPELSDGRLAFSRDGACCEWKTNGKIVDTGKDYANRDGHLRRYDASAKGRLKVRGIIYSSKKSPSSSIFGLSAKSGRL